MITITTRQGKQVEVVLESELCSPVDTGERVRAFCHIHGSDHQRSLSIDKATGWGHCFNATCEATVLVVEWNRALAKRLLHSHYRRQVSAALPDYTPPGRETRYRPYVVQPMLLPPPRSIPQWQQNELQALRELDGQMRCALVYTQRARMYLNERGIPLKVALATGVGYLPSDLLNGREMRRRRGSLRRWTDRIVFPLNSPDGRGYIGRSLWHWQPGMNEKAHKAVLEQSGSPKRWIKTYPAGWFSADFEEMPRAVILVEGAFDRLTLLAAGFAANEIIALVGTAAPLEWLGAQVKTVALALDGDEGGQEASSRLADQMEQAGLHVKKCLFSQDGRGKDWNERWQRMGRKSVAPVFETFYGVRSA